MSGKFEHSHKIPVSEFRITLMLPVLIQALKKDASKYVDPRLSPEQPGFLEAWGKYVDDNDAEWGAEWDLVNRVYPNKDGEDGRDGEGNARSYSEFCYFHPFVRNFLYVTRGDMREHERNSSGDSLPDRGEPVNRNLRILQRKGLGGAKLSVDYFYQVTKKEPRIELRSNFSLESFWVYMFDTQVAIAEMQLVYLESFELQNGEPGPPRPLNLRALLTLQDSIRRAYSTYAGVYESENGKTVVHRNSLVPNRMTLNWGNENGVNKIQNPKEDVVEVFGNHEFDATEFSAAQVAKGEFLERLEKFDNPKKDPQQNESSGPSEGEAKTEPDWLEMARSVKAQRDHVYEHREPYTSKIWRKLLFPILPVQYIKAGDEALAKVEGSTPAGLLRFEQIQDDRVPIMSHIVVGDEGASGKEGPDRMVRKISSGDWLRLASFDDPGDSGCYPYSPSFFPDDEPVKTFCYDRFWHPTGAAEQHAQDQMHCTRWLISASGFSGVGDISNPFFRNDLTGALCHFNHHYFSLFLIGLFHRASLLQFKHRLGEAADALLENKPQALLEWQFQEDSRRLSKEVMRFRTLYWFSEISNQIQGIELFSKLREHLNLEALFNDVVADIESADAMLKQWNEERQTQAANRLAALGIIATVLAPVLLLFNAKVEKSVGLAATATGSLAGLYLLFTGFPVHRRLGRCLIKKCHGWSWPDNKCLSWLLGWWPYESGLRSTIVSRLAAIFLLLVSIPFWVYCWESKSETQSSDESTTVPAAAVADDESEFKSVVPLLSPRRRDKTKPPVAGGGQSGQQKSTVDPVGTGQSVPDKLMLDQTDLNEAATREPASAGPKVQPVKIEPAKAQTKDLKSQPKSDSLKPDKLLKQKDQESSLTIE